MAGAWRNFLVANASGGKAVKILMNINFVKNSQALRVINSVYGHVPKGNCRGWKDSTDWEAESKPLPKRKDVKINHHYLRSVVMAPSLIHITNG